MSILKIESLCKYYGNKKTKLEYSWAKVKGAAGYQIYASNNKKFKKKIIVNVSKKYTSTKIIFNKNIIRATMHDNIFCAC